MDKQIAEQWAAELESGRWKQGKKRLSQGGEHCCLAVLCEMAIAAGVPVKKEMANASGLMMYDNHSDLPPPRVQLWAGLKSEHGDYREFGQTRWLAADNDDGRTFPEIAALIRQHAAEL